MTTPERLRRRQRRDAVFIAVLAFALVGGWFYFRHRTDNTVDCLVAYAENQSEASQIRGGLVSRESQATRKVITGARDVKTRAAFNELFDQYEASLQRIDRGRARHPVPGFDIEACTS